MPKGGTTTDATRPPMSRSCRAQLAVSQGIALRTRCSCVPRRWSQTGRMGSIYLVTHPEATHVVEQLVGAWYDSDLTPRGAEQAEKIAALIASRAVTTGTALFSSDLRRARHTAEAISAALEVTPVLDAGLREQSYGVAEGPPVGATSLVPLPAGGDRLRHHGGVAGSETRLDVASRSTRPWTGSPTTTLRTRLS